jgi:hypothetical protein
MDVYELGGLTYRLTPEEAEARGAKKVTTKAAPAPDKARTPRNKAVPRERTDADD